MSHVFPHKNFEVYECSDDVEYLYGSIHAGTIRCRELVVVGYLVVDGLLTVDRLVLIGGGRIGVLTCSEGVIITYSKPLIIGGVYCSKLFVNGSTKPVVINSCRARELCVRNALFNELFVRRVVFNERCGVRVFGGCREAVFNDPHIWFEEWSGCLEDVRFNYEVSSSEPGSVF